MLKKFLKLFLCMLLAVATVAHVAVGAYATTPKQYVKDVIIVYGDSLDDAKKNLPDGYTLLPHDFNKGAAYGPFAVVDAYLAYTTTTDPDEAITDMRMMNMNGGFVMSDYEDQLKNVNENVRTMAAEIKVAAEAFVANYKAGSNGAKGAYLALNAFKVDEADNMGLGDFFCEGKATDEFYVKLLLNAHTEILSTILTALAMGVQTEGNTWLDRLAAIEDPEAIYNSLYWDQATALWPHFDSFYKNYSKLDHAAIRSGTSNADGNDVLYETAYATLEGYSFKNGINVAEWLINDYIYEEMLYPLISVLTPAEYAMMHLCGLMPMVMATGMDAKGYEDYAADVNAIIAEMGTCSLWYGVNAELFQASIGVTDEAARAIAETKAAQELTNDGDSNLDHTLKLAGLIGATALVVAGVGLVAVSLGAGSLGAVLTGAVASSAMIGLAIGGALCVILGAAILAVALVVVVVFIVCWLIDLYNEHHPDYTEIPKYMYDLVKDEQENTQFVLYDAVLSHEGKCADVNSWDGSQWHAIYVTRDKTAGNPIEADFKVKHADGRVDEGYSGLCSFGHVVSDNLNRYADDDEVGGIYVSYRQEPLSTAPTEGKYLSDVKLFTDSNHERCKLQIKAEGYTLYDYNLTPHDDDDKVTLLGYKTTNKATLALTDIRFSYKHDPTSYSTGGANDTYAASGSAGDLTLYTTKISMFGSPILSEFVMLDQNEVYPEGFEPVNLFTGGAAVNIAKEGKDAYKNNGKVRIYMFFLPSEAYTSGTEYLGGLFVTVSPKDKTAACEEMMSEKLGASILATSMQGNDKVGYVMYTTTYNPYRALYGVTTLTNGSSLGDDFQPTFLYEQISYSRTARYIVDNDKTIQYDTDFSRDDDTRIYVAGIYKGGSPMVADDIRVSSDPKFTETGYTPVVSCLWGRTSPEDLLEPFTKDDAPLYLFVKGEAYEEGDYITALYVSSKEQLTGGQGDCDDIDNSYVMAQLAAMGAHTVIRKNVNIEESDNATYIAYTKQAGSRTPIRDIVLYFMNDTSDEPESKVTLNNMVYHLASDVNLFCDEGDLTAKCDRVYVYYTTNPAAGDPIIDIKIDNEPIVNGWETVLSQNDLALYDDMNEYEDDMVFIHVKRAEEDAKYISKVVVGVGDNKEDAFAVLLKNGCTHFVDKDLNDGVGAHSDYIYVGYQKTNDLSLAIRDLRTLHDKDDKSFTKNGATYTKISGNLNSYTNLFADDIYLFYSTDVEAGDPLVNLYTKSKAETSTRGDIAISTVLNQKDKPSDLNDGATGDYIYLIMESDTTADDTPAAASMIGTGSAISIAILSLLFIGSLVIVFIQQKKLRQLTRAGR